MITRPSLYLIGSGLRRVRARKTLAAASIGLVLLGFSAFAKPAPLLVWNASASAPLGLYGLGLGAARTGDFVLVRMPNMVGQLADQRGYLPRGVPLVKRVAALRSEHVCAFNDAIIIGGKIAARRLKADSQGRPLPWWNECRPLAGNEVFLISGDAPGSFDSRYFGPVPSANIVGRLVPLWAE
ncbi:MULTISPECIES: S26 family signal peptidase [unclassified Mesorhizobium]|uniref:S26 family signal peptidase n=1 Tax=unclassified Mesorhizobium TaxID=325217 RepID=UPI000FDA79AE|nr:MULTISPECIES: S26 family signal peptidase [unclassified Mesorhizobium]TGT71817.1 S26 family signal peptidase [Mesorhizobium sp. M2E.F.Ca.ET.166.01.1.1]TGV99469.1 S26 family signal peptidase [Mesorhizobium sp. M2E.F.Ca.ET.154.01.1.1]